MHRARTPMAPRVMPAIAPALRPWLGVEDGLGIVAAVAAELTDVVLVDEMVLSGVGLAGFVLRLVKAGVVVVTIDDGDGVGNEDEDEEDDKLPVTTNGELYCSGSEGSL